MCVGKHTLNLSNEKRLQKINLKNILFYSFEKPISLGKLKKKELIRVNIKINMKLNPIFLYILWLK
jgi:hypothetical protein